MRKAAILTVIITFVTQAALAEQVTIRGSGALECKFWSAWRTPPIPEYGKGLNDYVMGYIAGRSVALGHDLLKYTNNDAIMEEMDKQCKLKPSVSIADAARTVAQMLEQ